MDLQGIVALLGVPTIAGVVVWAVRQEGRVNAHDQLFKERKQLDDERHEDNKKRLQRIEAKLDSLPLRLNGHS